MSGFDTPGIAGTRSNMEGYCQQIRKILGFVKKEKRKRRKPHLREKIGLCGERKLNLLNIKMMLRGSLTSDKNK